MPQFDLSEIVLATSKKRLRYKVLSGTLSRMIVGNGERCRVEARVLGLPPFQLNRNYEVMITGRDGHRFWGLGSVSHSEVNDVNCSILELTLSTGLQSLN